MQHRPRKKLLLKRGVLLLLGAVVNVAVAWTAAFLPEDNSSPDCVIELAQVQPSQLSHIATCIVKTRTTARYEFFDKFDPTGNWRIVDDLSADVPHWANRFANLLQMEQPNVSRDSRIAIGRASGWPALSMSGGISLMWDAGSLVVVKSHWAVFIPPNAPHRNDQSRIIPLRPITSGFAINTFFYAALLWLLIFAPRTIRRVIRVRKGQCPACAYPVGTSPVCTECGHPVSLRRSAGM